MPVDPTYQVTNHSNRWFLLVCLRATGIPCSLAPKVHFDGGRMNIFFNMWPWLQAGPMEIVRSRGEEAALETLVRWLVDFIVFFNADTPYYRHRLFGLLFWEDDIFSTSKPMNWSDLTGFKQLSFWLPSLPTKCQSTKNNPFVFTGLVVWL